MKKNLFLFLLIIFCLVGISLGFVLERYLDVELTKRKFVPLPAELLTNPLTQSLAANVEGRVINKGENYLTLSKNLKDKQGLRIYVEEASGLTAFTEQRTTIVRSLRLADIKTGDYLVGGVNILLKDVAGVGNTSAHKAGDLIGQRFAVGREEP